MSGKMYRLIDIITLSLLFVACSIPVFTIGAAVTALNYSARMGLKNKDEAAWRYFMPCFKESFKQSTVIWGLMLLAFTICGLDMWFWRSSDSAISGTMLIIPVVLAALVLMICLYVFYLQSVKDNKISIQIKNAFILSIRYLPTTLVLALILAGTSFLMYLHPLIFGIAVVVMGAGLIGYAFAYIYIRTFEPVAEEEHKAEETGCEPETEKAKDITAVADEEPVADDETGTAADDCEEASAETALEDEASEADEIDPDDDRVYDRKEKSISLSDADEDERNRIKSEKEAEARAAMEERLRADLEARRVAEELAGRVKETVMYETSGDNVYRRDTNALPARRGSKPSKRQRKK